MYKYSHHILNNITTEVKLSALYKHLQYLHLLKYNYTMGEPLLINLDDGMSIVDWVKQDGLGAELKTTSLSPTHTHTHVTSEVHVSKLYTTNEHMSIDVYYMTRIWIYTSFNIPRRSVPFLIKTFLNSVDTMY